MNVSGCKEAGCVDVNAGVSDTVKQAKGASLSGRAVKGKGRLKLDPAAFQALREQAIEAGAKPSSKPRTVEPLNLSDTQPKAPKPKTEAQKKRAAAKRRRNKANKKNRKKMGEKIKRANEGFIRLSSKIEADNKKFLSAKLQVAKARRAKDPIAKEASFSAYLKSTSQMDSNVQAFLESINILDPDSNSSEGSSEPYDHSKDVD
ncbi:MAG: hypothetical protein S4CHLAM20_05070 [Chlamydiia bacterium]|nr:hypothetical protein [Chlamydiia bacterium]